MRSPGFRLPVSPASFCSLTTMAVLVAVPSFRLLQQQYPDTPWMRGASMNGGVTGGKIREKAAPLLVRLSPEQGEVLVTVENTSDGGLRRYWSVVARTRSQGVAADGETELAESRYDVDTGGLIYVCSTSAMRRRHYPSDRPPLTAPEAIQAARSWLPALGLAHAGRIGESGAVKVAPIVFPPQKKLSGFWRVWLRGHETPGGPPLTVQVAIATATGEFLSAGVVERVEAPLLYLPRRFSRPLPAVRTTACSAKTLQ